MSSIINDDGSFYIQRGSNIKITILGGNQYEFKVVINNSIDYCAKSVLKHIYIEDVKDFMDYGINKIDIQYTDYQCTLKLPIPFTERYESVYLERPDARVIQLKRTQMELELKTQAFDDLNKKYQETEYLFRLLKADFDPMNRYKSDVINIVFVRDFSSLYLGYIPYIYKLNLFTPSIMKRYKLTLENIKYLEGYGDNTDGYLRLSEFGYVERNKCKNYNLVNVLNHILGMIGYKKITTIKLEDRGLFELHKVYLTVNIDESETDYSVSFCSTATDDKVELGARYYKGNVYRTCGDDSEDELDYI